jgi:hypothetical protein
VIVGGACRGYNRALRISGQYVLAYFVVGVGLMLGIGPLLVPWSIVPEFLMGALFAHLWISLIVFLLAMAANQAFVRMFKRRTWRNERWRKWVAGGLGLVLTWGGMFLLEGLRVRVPDTLRTLVGPMAGFVHYGGWFVLLSNLGLLVAWLIPSRRGQGGG